MFNGMVQGLVLEGQRKVLAAFLPADTHNTMSASQCAHHVTLAFKPQDIEAVRAKFQRGRLGFVARRLLCRHDVAAVFGDVVDFSASSILRTDAHITLGGTAQPKDSLTLPAQHSWGAAVCGCFELEYCEVLF